MNKKNTSVLYVGLLAALSLVTFDLYQPSLSYITHFFSTTHKISQLSLSLYLFIFGVTQLLWGPLIDHFGRRRLLPGSLILVIVSSILCAFAPNIYLLIFGRVLQGFAICCSSLIAFSTSRDVDDPIERAKILSYISMIVSVSPILAPVIGSIIFTYLGWQANFLFMAAIASLLFLLSKNNLSESPFWSPPQNSFFIKPALNSYKAIAGLPMIWCASFIMMFSFAAVMITVINSSYLIIDLLGFSSLGFGILFVFNGLNIILGNYLGIWLRERLTMASTIYLGNGLIILGGFLMYLYTAVYSFDLIALSFALICNLGISVSAPPTMSLALSDFKENTGLVLAFISTVRLFGSSLLSIIIGSMLLKNTYSLPLGLIVCGAGAAYFSYHFNRLMNPPKDTELEEAQTA